jgi:hypothetical protein
MSVTDKPVNAVLGEGTDMSDVRNPCGFDIVQVFAGS